MTARTPSKQVRPANSQTNGSDGATRKRDRTSKQTGRAGKQTDLPDGQTAGPDGPAGWSDGQTDRTDEPAGWSDEPAGWSAGWSALPIRLRYALGIAFAGGVLLAIGPLLPVVSPAMPPGFAAGPLMFVLGLLPIGVALVLASRGSVAAARGALLAAALFAPGRAIADAQLAIQGSIAARPELVMPTALLKLHGATGLWLLLAGEALVLAAGLFALTTNDTDPPPNDSRRPSSHPIPTDNHATPIPTDNATPSDPNQASTKAIADPATSEPGRTPSHAITTADPDPAPGHAAAGGDSGSTIGESARISSDVIDTDDSDPEARGSGGVSGRVLGSDDPDPVAGESGRASRRATGSGTYSASRNSAHVSGRVTGDSDSTTGDSGGVSGSAIASGNASSATGESGAASGGVSATRETDLSGDSGRAPGRVVAGGDSDLVAGDFRRASGSAVGGGDIDSAGHGSGRVSGRTSASRNGGDSARAFGRAIDSGGTGSSAGEAGRTSSGYQGPVLIALGLGVVVALGLMAVPFTSSTPFVLANGVLDAPIMALAGGLLIAVAAPLAATIAATAADPVAARGWLLGAQAVVLAIAFPRVVSGLAVHGLHPSWGPYVAVGAALLLVGIGFYTERVIRPAPDDDAEPAELQLPGQSRLHVATGVLGLVAAGAALVGADTNLYVLSADLPHNTDVAGRLLVPAAVLIGVCAVGMLIPRWASVVRPAFAVAWVSVLLAGFGALDTAMTATQIDGVRLGIGTWATGLAMLAALAAACTAGLAGGVERDDVDLTELSWRPQVLAPAAVAAALAIGAFGLPVLKADGFTPPGIWSDFRFASWGLVFSLVAVLAAALLSPICRPARAVGLLLGAAGLVLVRLLSFPLDRSTAPGTGAGTGMLIAVACLLALVVAAGMAGWLARKDAVARAAARRAARKPVRAGARRR